MTATHPIELIMSKLSGVKPQGSGFEARCPAHDDRHASLSIKIGEDGRVLLKCHAGCTNPAIVSSLGLHMRDLFPPREDGHQQHNGNGQGKKLVATYDYTDRELNLLFQCRRYQPKNFKQCRPDGSGGFIFNLEGVETVLYRLPDLMEADPSQWVFIAEGEKDVDRLLEMGLVATCNPMGAGKWKGERAERYAETLRGRRLCIIADKDKAGRDHAHDVATSCQGKASEIRIIEVPGAGKDASDYFDAGGTAEELVKLADSAAPFDPAKKEEHSAPKSILEMMKLYPHLRPELIRGLLRTGEIMNIIAPPKFGKSWLVILIALMVATGQILLGKFSTVRRKVLILDNELHSETSASRIPKVAETLGIPIAEYGEQIFVENMRGKLRDIYSLREYFDSVAGTGFGVIVLDAFYRFLPMNSDENSNAEIANIYNFLDSYAAKLGCCFILIHHSSKGSQSEKAVTDVGSGAGSQSRAADTHLILRQHEDDGVMVLDAATRSWAPIEPFCIRWQYPIWQPAPDCDPSLLRRAGTKRRARSEDVEHEPTSTEWTVDTFVATFLASEPRSRDAIMAAADLAKLSERKADRLLRLAEESGKAFRWTMKGQVGKPPIKFATIEQPLTATVGEGK